MDESEKEISYSRRFQQASNEKTPGLPTFNIIGKIDLDAINNGKSKEELTRIQKIIKPLNAQLTKKKDTKIYNNKESIETFFGVIEWFNIEKGFGVITRINDNKDFFLHVKDLINSSDDIYLEKGCPIFFHSNYDNIKKREFASKVFIAKDVKGLKDTIEFLQQNGLEIKKDENILKKTITHVIYEDYKKNIINITKDLTDYVVSSQFDLVSVLCDLIINCCDSYFKPCVQCPDFDYRLYFQSQVLNNISFEDALNLFDNKNLPLQNNILLGIKNSSYFSTLLNEITPDSIKVFMEQFANVLNLLNRGRTNSFIFQDAKHLTDRTLFNDYIGYEQVVIFNEYIRQLENHSLMVAIYKCDYMSPVDVDFIIYNKSEFSSREIEKYIRAGQLSKEAKLELGYKHFNDLVENYKSEYSYNCEIKSLLNAIKTAVPENYNLWLNNALSGITEDLRFTLWINDIVEISQEEFLYDKISAGEKRYIVFLKKLLSSDKINQSQCLERLLSFLVLEPSLSNRDEFQKAFDYIKLIVEIDKNYAEKIHNIGNSIYNLLLWKLDVLQFPDLETFCNIFIYFKPEDQVTLLKKLFKEADCGKIELSIDVLRKIKNIDKSLFYDIAEMTPSIPIDISCDIIINNIISFHDNGSYLKDAEVLAIILNNSKYNKKYDFKIRHFFDICKGRTEYQWCGSKTVKGNISFDKNYCLLNVYTYIQSYGRNGYEKEWNSDFQIILSSAKELRERIYDSAKCIWKVPIQYKDDVIKFAKQYNFTIEGDRNIHLKKYKWENSNRPSGVNFCEGRPAMKTDDISGKDFFWCRNSKCYQCNIQQHNSDQWNDYTILDFCRILGINLDSTDNMGRIIAYGKYLILSSIINRANYMLEHLKCKECGNMLDADTISNYATNLVTKFKCTTNGCSEYGKSLYISKCFNWKCNGIIDQRETKACPNGWLICKQCGSCCSNRIVQQRIDNQVQVGVHPSSFLYDFVRKRLGHLEKREFYCYKCNSKMTSNDDIVFSCPNSCKVEYNRRTFDFEVNMFISKV